MKTNNSKTKTKAFLGAAFMLLIALIFTACPQKAKPKAEEAHLQHRLSTHPLPTTNLQNTLQTPLQQQR